MKEILINNEVYVFKKEADAAIKTASKGKVKTVTAQGRDIPFQIGGKYFMRTVTYFATGEVVAVHGDFLELKTAAWVADTGRFQQAIMNGILDEVEPVDVPMYVNMNTITDAFVWEHDLPTKQK